jgi:TolB-like protein
MPAQAQRSGKPRLGIIPFAGGSGGDGETIAELFSMQRDITRAFTVVPRTSAVDAIVAEQEFQEAGYTDTDTLAGLGKRLNAEFVVSGHIRKLGDRNLVITTIVHVESFELLAGDYRQYGRVEEIRGMLPDIAKIIINASKQQTASLPRLGILPFNTADERVNRQDAETLAQILMIEIANTNKYVALPRTNVIQAALQEMEHQSTGATSDTDAAKVGAAIKAEFVLSANVRSLGTLNMFTASILGIDGSQHAGDFREYRIVEDGMSLMRELAIALADPDAPVSGGDPAQGNTANSQTTRPAAKEPRVRTKAPANARFWSIGISAGSTLATPLAVGTIHGTLAPFPYTFLELGVDAGFVAMDDGTGWAKNLEGYYSIYPFGHIAVFLPFASRGGFYFGGGAGYMIGEYNFGQYYGVKYTTPINIFAADIIIGINIANVIDLSYTLRTDFETASNKLSIGYVYRFK